eukprot:c13569_g1_i1 orf=173-5542(+)
MPASVDAAGRRKVRCPKCTALLKEPQTDIYECPVCNTLLLAKGNIGSRLTENRTRNSSGDTGDIQQIVEGGLKLEKASLINEFDIEKVQLGVDNVESEGNVSFEGRSRIFQLELSYENTEAVSNIPSEGRSQKSVNLSFESPLDTPGRRRLPHLGDISLKGESKHQFPELDSASHTESEVDLDSPIWSSENANTNEVPEVSLMVRSFEASSPLDRSCEHLSTMVPSPSSGANGNDCAHTLQDENEPEGSQWSNARFGDRGAEEAKDEEKHCILPPNEVVDEEVLQVEKKLDLDPRIRNFEVLVATSCPKSVLDEGCALKGQISGEVSNDKEIDSSHNSSSDCRSDGLAGSIGTKSSQFNLVDSRSKETATGATKLPRNDGNRTEMSSVGKFRLFDLSVFGIYNEETYSELRRGMAAQYSKLSDGGSDGDGLQSPVDGEQGSHSGEVVASNCFRDQDFAGDGKDENIAEVQQISSVSELPVVDTDGSYVETGSYGEMYLEAPQQDSDVRSSSSVGQEGGDGGIDVGDAGLVPVTSTDIDAIANDRYGDFIIPSVQGVSSVDVSFVDWGSQQVVKSPQVALEQNHADVDSVHEKRMVNMARGEGTDSSWDDDDDELTFQSISKEDSNLKETASMEKEVQTSTGTRSSGMSQPAFPFRTTAMKKFLKREDQEKIAQTQSLESFLKEDSKLYEAPYIEHYTPPPQKIVEETYDQTVVLMSEQNVYDTAHVKEQKPLMIAVTKASEEMEKNFTELQEENPLGAHFSLSLNEDNEGVSRNPLSRTENDVQTVLIEDVPSKKESDSVRSPQSDATVDKMDRNESDSVRSSQTDATVDKMDQKESDSVRSPQRDATVDKMDQRGIQMVALDSQKVDYWHANKVGTASGKPASLRWKGKASSTQSLSSTEDEGAYGTDFEVASGPDRDSAKKQGVGLTEGHSFPNKEVKLGLGQQPQGHNQPNARPSQRNWSGNVNVDRPKHRSGELVSSRRTARNRLSIDRLPNQDSFEQADRFHMEGRIPNLDTLGRLGFDRGEQAPAFQGQSLNMNRNMLDQGGIYCYNGTADYNSDHSSRSHEVPPHSQYNERYLSSTYGLPVATSTRAHPFQVPPHGSIPPAPGQEQGLTHPAHHCVSPSCSLCIQQQYYMQQPQMLQNMMLHPCAACASQSSAAAYQPMHHEMHGHHMHALTYSNPSLRQHDSRVLPAQSQRQNRSSIHPSHPVSSVRRLKLHPPLPGKGAPPYVLCRACYQLIQVPGYLPPMSGPIQKLNCGACGKTSKFSIPLPAPSPSANRAFWPTSAGSAMNASDMHNFLARDTRYSSEQMIPSVGLSTSAQNLYGTARRTSGQVSQHEWVENRVFLQPHASGIPSSIAESVHPQHYPRPMAGGLPGQAQYRSQGRHSEGERPHPNTGLYSEDYASSSPSSASGSSPGGHPQTNQQIQQVEPPRMGRPGFGERNLSADLPDLSYEAPSFSDGFFRKGANEGRSRYSSTSLQGSLHDPLSDSPRNNEHRERLQMTSKAGSWHNQPADAEYSDRSSSRNRTEQLWKMPAVPGSPLIEHFSREPQDAGPTTKHPHMLQNSGNGARSAPWSPASESALSSLFDPYTQDASTIDFSERSHDSEHPPLPVQEVSKGPRSFRGLLKRSIKDLGKGGQGGNNRRKVVVNGHVIPEAAVRKAEEQAGAIHSGTYWYDYQAGFWGVMGGPCSGILMPFIEEFQFPLARDCAGGTTGILVNGRELHEKDLDVLAKRGLPRIPGMAYILDISGALFDDVSGQPLRGLGRLAPSIEKKGRGFGMSQFAAQP